MWVLAKFGVAANVVLCHLMGYRTRLSCCANYVTPHMYLELSRPRPWAYLWLMAEEITVIIVKPFRQVAFVVTHNNIPRFYFTTNVLLTLIIRFV